MSAPYWSSTMPSTEMKVMATDFLILRDPPPATKSV
jgi:hypothetical protein